MKMIGDLDIQASETVWHELISSSDEDILLFSDSSDLVVYFVSNYTQFLIRSGENEVAVFYGKHIHSLADFCYQANTVLPCAFKRKVDLEVLYDLLLNLKTEPLSRILIWNDAQELYNENSKLFADIFERLVTAAYCNRKGIATIKEDNSRYQVNQQNIFVFKGLAKEDVQDILLNKEYYIPSIDAPFYSKISFKTINLYDSIEVHAKEMRNLFTKNISEIVNVFEQASDSLTLDFLYDNLLILTRQWKDSRLVKIAETKLSQTDDSKGWRLDQIIDAKKLIN